jgi:hypothetical protein
MNSLEKLRNQRVPVMAAILFGISGLWYISLGLNHFYDLNRLAGLPFIWTAFLGICPFVGLALAALLVEARRKSRGSSRELLIISLAVGLSPWLWLLGKF